MKVTLVTAEEWEALYVDGELVDQNHSLSLHSVLEELESRGILDYSRQKWNEKKTPLDDVMPELLKDCVLK